MDPMPAANAIAALLPLVLVATVASLAGLFALMLWSSRGTEMPVLVRRGARR